MKVKSKLVLATALLATSIGELTINDCVAQDIHFSQYQYSPLTLNPALAGMYNGDARILTNYKNQWSAIMSPYKTFAVSYDAAFMKQKWKKGFLGAGLSVFSDKAGDSEMSTTQIALSVSSNKALDAYNDISVGLQAGFAQSNVNSSQLFYGNQYNGSSFDPTISSEENLTANKFTYGDFAAGLNWNYGKGTKYSTTNNQLKANAGFSVFHANRPKQNFDNTINDRMNAKISVYGNMLIGLNKDFAVLPSIIFLKQGATKEISAGAMFRYLLKEESKYTNYIDGAAFSVGMYHRLGDAIIIASQLEVAHYAIGLSYDINTSGLTKASSGRGGFELSLRYVNPNPFNGRRTNSNTRFLN